jgi:hypothetical protein
MTALALVVGLAAALVAAPELPRATVDAGPPSAPLRRIEVGAGGDLQAALDAARDGDAILLASGATYEGTLVLRPRPGDGWVVVRTTASDDTLPAIGSRVSPGDFTAMPKLVSRSGPVIRAAAGARGYRFVGVEIRPVAGVFLHELVELGGDDIPTDRVPHHIIFDRCYLHGDPALGSRRGIALNGAHAAVVGSYLADFKERGADSQAIAGWCGPGPFLIEGNYLEGAGENVMFGGADPRVPGLVPSDIEIRGNHLAKPLAWRDAGGWSVKNLLELKNARRVMVEGNLLENNWGGGQSGFAILLTVRNQDGGSPWSTVEDVTLRNNVVRRSASAIHILARDDTWPAGSARSKRITIRNNLFEEIDGTRFEGGGVFLQILEGAADVVVESNTVDQTGNVITAEGTPHTGFVFRRNVVRNNAYGITGTDTGPGLPTLERYFPGARIDGNVFIGGDPGQLPPGNKFPRSLPASSTRAAVGAAGVDMTALCRALPASLSGLVRCSVPPRPDGTSGKPTRAGS